jgi:hypothetical protein
LVFIVGAPYEVPGRFGFILPVLFFIGAAFSIFFQRVVISRHCWAFIFFHRGYVLRPLL